LSVLGLGSNSDVQALTELVTTLEEEVEILSAQGGTADNSKLEKRLNTLTEKNDRLNNQLAEINGTMLNNSSGPAVDDLLEKNLQAQKTVEQLLSRVEQLEIGIIARKPKSTARKKINPVAIVESNRWFVNLVSFKQEWFARKKATEFEKKGVPTQVVSVKVNTEDWYRLRVTGFTSKYDAASYAVKVKKTLNLSSVWVTND
jgi:cell division protein FtsN